METRMIRTFCLTLALTAVASAAMARQTDPLQRPPDVDFAPVDKPPASKIPATAFVMPDVPDEWNKKTTFDGRAFSSRASIVIIGDYTTFSQDDASISQVGVQKNQWDLRTFRLMSSG